MNDQPTGHTMNNPQNALHRVFGRARVFLPVIHPRSRETALQSIDTALHAGAITAGVVHLAQQLCASCAKWRPA